MKNGRPGIAGLFLLMKKFHLNKFISQNRIDILHKTPETAV